MKKDHLEHLLVSLGIMLVVAALLWALSYLIPYTPLVGGAVAGIAFFWGRERRDHEIKTIKDTGCTLESLSFKGWFPWSWSEDGQWDFYWPVIGCVGTLLIVSIVQKLW